MIQFLIDLKASSPTLYYSTIFLVAALVGAAVTQIFIGRR